MAVSAASVVLVLELVGLYVFATSGALLAIRKGFDLVGIVILALLTALGGGILRDLIIGDIPPAAFTNVAYLVIPPAAAAVTFFAHPVVQRLSFTMLVFDAAGLGLFCVTGTLKALDVGLGPVQAVLLGITPQWVKIWNRHGLIRGHACNDKNSCLYEHPGESPPRKAQGVKLSLRRLANEVLSQRTQEVQCEA